LALAEIEASEALTPPLKWAGGKRWLVPHLLRLWKPHAHRRLVEPFVGGLAVTLGLQPERALLNDANPHLIWFYQNLQRGLVLDPKTAGFANDRAVYGAHRVRFNQLIADGMGHTPEAAGLFYYLNRTGFNGLCRFNRSGAFNVPHGRYSAALSYRYDFLGYTSALRSYDFACGDFGDINIDVADFIYADPPYDVEFVSLGPTFL
jgi:DNA adenine methylase